MTLTGPRLIRWMLIGALLGVLTGIVLRADDDGCDEENPTEVCLIVYFPADGWCHWLEPYTPLWDFLNCRQEEALAAASVFAIGAPEVESVPFGEFRLVTIRQGYSDGIVREFYRLVPTSGQRATLIRELRGQP